MALEAKLGRYLTPDEHVHHINHIRDDDRPENLEALTASAHSRLHIEDRYRGRRVKGFACGSAINKAKLTESDIPKIFAMRSQGHTQKAIAAEFGVVQQLVSEVLRRKLWRHVNV